ncbi:MAG: exodeoxyribonuclease V subunit gamma [Thermodesulfobacteriota bacterium]|nr:exodeoxyribonuclease V subunit gamma [Thermodesulfobacteriota bacterium]
MHNLKIYTSNHMEILAQQLARILRDPLPSPLVPEIIVVQSRGMERWVSMEIAGYNGICANCSFLFPNLFLHEIVKKLIPDLPEDSPFDPVAMTFKIMNVLQSSIHLPGYESLKRYMVHDKNGMKLFQISQKIADLFDQYLVFRPEMIFRWEKGKEDHWQAQLWREISSGKENLHRARMRKTLLEKIKKQPHEIENLPDRISIFGISYLPPFHLETFIEISRLSQVNLFLMNPCREYWAEIVSPRQIKEIQRKYITSTGITEELYLEEGNRLLSSMGTLGRNFFSMISGIDCQMFEQFKDQDKHNMLSKIQWDIHNLKDRKFYSQDSVPDLETSGISSPLGKTDSMQQDVNTSVQIHSCHSPMREIEVLHDNLLAMFEEDPDLLPKDIVVMAPDIESYAPFIQAVFDAQTDEALRIPFTIADRGLRKESRIIEAFLSILDLKGSRLGTTSVMVLLESAGIKEQFGLTESDIEIVERWIKETNIRWGMDADFRRELGLPGFSENTWKAGIERLLLGYALPGLDRKLFSGILPYDQVEGGEVKILGKFLNFLDRVFHCMGSLDTPRTLSDWHLKLIEILEEFFASDEDSEREIQVLRRILDEMSQAEELSGFDRPIEIEVVKSFLENLLECVNFGTGFISSGVTFCAMLPMRSIPFKVVCLVGMNMDAFPRESKTLSFDLMAKNPRIGDRSRRNDDKYLFLEAIISARNKFYISYVGQSIRDNTRIAPSVLVSELIDYIKEGFGLSEDQMVTLHRLQAFSPEYFKAGGKLFSYSRENFAASCSRYEHKDILSLISSKLPDPAQEWKHLDIKDLSAFFSNPAKFLLEKRLGIYLHETADVYDERENFNLGHLEKYMLEQEMVLHRLFGSELKDFLPVKKASGQLPHGNVGEFVYNEMSLDAEGFVRKIEGHITGKQLDNHNVDIDIAGFNLCGRLTDVYEQGLIRIRYVKIKPKYLLKTWVHHVILCVLVEGKRPVKSFLLCKDAAWEFTPVSNSTDILNDLLKLLWKGMSEPLHFFPESSFEYARKLLMKHQTISEALNSAKNKWTGNDFVRGESEDPYFERCFGKTDPLDQDFGKIAEQVFAPLLDHCREIVL